MISRVSRHVLVVGLLFATLACVRASAVSAVSAEPARTTSSEPTPVFIEARPLSCDGTLAAIIGERGVPMAAFEHIYELKVAKYRARGRGIPPTADVRYHRIISERLIYQEVLALEAAKLGVEYDPAALEQREQASKTGIKDWEQHLHRRGESEASLRALYIAELQEQAILAATGALTIHEEEIAAEYDRVAPDFTADEPRVRAAHIIVRVEPPVTEAEALAKAEAIHQQAIQPDVDFAELAEQHSEGPSKQKGGDLGIFTADRMVEEFSKPVFKLKPGEVSRPIRTKFGYHVVKVYGVWGPGPLPREALEPQIVERLLARKLHQGRRDLKARLLDEYAPRNCIPALAESRGLRWPDTLPSGVLDDQD
jgi:peptidyl-prolyl cis-trans isomerase C